MSSVLPLHEIVTVSSRFARSVSLLRDFESPGALDGYILTPVGRDVLGRLEAAFSGHSATRAWTLTGPYGSGKSAFALLVAQLLAGEPKVRECARRFLQQHDAKSWSGLFDRGAAFPKETARLFPVLVTGSRQSLERALAASLAQALRDRCPRGRTPHVIEKLELVASSEEPTGHNVATLFEEANEFLRRFEDDALGILLIIDELGKFLEYGASHPDRGDVFVLQQVAEAAARSKRPFVILTILHQAIDRYAEHMSPTRRAEWAKVQGRFEDVAFEERTEQLIRLLSHAIRIDGADAAKGSLQKQAKSLASGVAAAGIRVGSLGNGDLTACLAACFPLHPLTALTVGPLFRQLAQNERSLFAFLVSSEPSGFQEFLRTNEIGPKGSPTYRLDALYDYVIATLGPSLYAHHRGKAWAEVEAALERLRDASPLAIRVAKVIGLLQAAGLTSAAVASKAMLQLSLHGVASEREIDSALDSLQRKSITIFRRHLGSYAGSSQIVSLRLDTL